MSSSAADSGPGPSISCPHADRCAGCKMIGLSYPDQLNAKRRQVEGAVARYAALGGLAVDAVLAAEECVDYRVRAKLMVDVASANDSPEKASRPVIGLYARHPAGAESDLAREHTVVDIPGCRVLHPRLRQVASRLRDLLGRPPPLAGAALIPARAGGRLSAFDLRHVEGDGEVRRSGGVLVTLVLESGPALDGACRAAAVEAIRNSGPVLGVAVNYRDAGAPQVLGPATRVLWGTSFAPDHMGGTYHLATYGSFVQAHRGQSERIVQLIATHLAQKKPLAETRILDLYGGSGAISLPLAKSGARVTLVEAFAPAAECADRAAREQGIADFDVQVGDASAVARRLFHAGERFDAVITNPPRRGMAGATRGLISDLAPEIIAYVSCEPDTFTRDLADFAWLGYRAARVRPVDMIPLSDHVEIVALLEKGPRPPPHVLYDDLGLYAVSKRAYERADTFSNEGARLLWSPDVDESGPVLMARRGSLSTPPEHAVALAAYLALVRGVSRKRGSLGSAHYERVAIVGGHSLLRWSSRKPARRARQDLARIGHPVIGDLRFGDAATNRHFEEKHTLDRPFLHCMKLEYTLPFAARASQGALPHSSPVIKTPLADELAAVLGKFGIDAAKQLMVG